MTGTTNRFYRNSGSSWRNISGYDCPAGGVVEVQGVSGDTDKFQAIDGTRPTGEDVTFIINGNYAVPAGGFGRAVRDDHFFVVTSESVTVGDLLGPKQDSWEAKKADSGVECIQTGAEGEVVMCKHKAGTGGGGTKVIVIDAEVRSLGDYLVFPVWCADYTEPTNPPAAENITYKRYVYSAKAVPTKYWNEELTYDLGGGFLPQEGVEDVWLHLLAPTPTAIRHPVLPTARFLGIRAGSWHPAPAQNAPDAYESFFANGSDPELEERPLYFAVPTPIHCLAFNSESHGFDPLNPGSSPGQRGPIVPERHLVRIDTLWGSTRPWISIINGSKATKTDKLSYKFDNGNYQTIGPWQFFDVRWSYDSGEWEVDCKSPQLDWLDGEIVEGDSAGDLYVRVYSSGQPYNPNFGGTTFLDIPYASSRDPLWPEVPAGAPANTFWIRPIDPLEPGTRVSVMYNSTEGRWHIKFAECPSQLGT